MFPLVGFRRAVAEDEFDAFPDVQFDPRAHRIPIWKSLLLEVFDLHQQLLQLRNAGGDCLDDSRVFRAAFGGIFNGDLGHGHVVWWMGSLEKKSIRGSSDRQETRRFLQGLIGRARFSRSGCLLRFQRSEGSRGVLGGVVPAALSRHSHIG